VDWEDDRHKVHESFTQAMLSKVLTDGDRDYIGEIDKRLLQEMVMALTPSSGSGAPSMRPYNIRDMLQKADSRSVREDHKQSRTPADLGIETRTPMARHYTEGMQQLFKEEKWLINQPSGGCWVLGPSQDLYLAWPRCGMELYDYLLEAGISGVPKAPEIIAETLAGRQVILPAPDSGYYWRIKPGDLGGAPLTAVRLEPQWARHLAGLLPPGLNGYVESDEGGSSSWLYVEPGGASVQAPQDYSGKKVVPLRQSPEMRAVTSPEATMEKADLDRIMGEAAPGNPGIEAQPTEAGKPAEMGGWRRSIILLVFGICLGSLGNIALLLYMFRQVEPDISYSLSFWMMMGNAFDTGWFVIVLILGLISIAVMKVYSITVQELKEAKKKAAEIEAEAQEILDSARQDAMDIVAGAGREAGEIKKTAKEEAAQIRIKAKEEAADVRERANQEAAQEAEAIRKQAEEDAKGKVDQAREKMNKFWLLVEAKAAKVGVPSAELPDLFQDMQEAEKEAEDIIARAEIKAQEAAEDIIAEARAQAHEAAGEIVAQAKTQAQKNSQELLNIAREEAAEIVDQARARAAEIRQGQIQGTQEAGEIAAQLQEARQVNDDQSIQECLPEEKTSEGNMEAEADDLKNVDAFINDRCVLGAEISTKASDLYEAYLEWADGNGVHNRVSQTSFAGILRGRGFVRVKTNKANIWRGIGLRSTVGEVDQPSTMA
jgi:vacuolar-type H+-ATPase subunit H